DPTSRHSFLSFLRETRRLYRFVVANPAHVSRVEYEQYYRWVARRLPSLRFGARAESIDVEDGLFAARTAATTTRAVTPRLRTGRGHDAERAGLRPGAAGRRRAPRHPVGPGPARGGRPPGGRRGRRPDRRRGVPAPAPVGRRPPTGAHLDLQPAQLRAARRHA